VCVSAEEVKAGTALDLAVLTRRMKENDETAYRIFYDAYHGRLWRYLLVVTHGDEEAASEALQAALVRVVRHIKVFTTDEAFWRWLTVLARTALSDQRRGRRRYFAFLDRFGKHTEIQSSPDEATANAQLFALLECNLKELPADERALVEAKYYDERSVRDIAAELGTSEKAIESRLVRARRKLKLALLLALKNE
jgi:RNA polymerase sigma factor (sigma-70 family)